MRRWRVGTFSMGLLLIAVGIVLFISEIKGLQGAEQIIKLWPIVLIILGVEILAYIFLSKEEHPKIKFDGFSIFIIIIIIFLSSGAYVFNNLINSAYGSRIVTNIMGYKYSTVITKNITINSENKTKFYLENSSGNIDIEETNGKNIEIEALINIENNDEKYAKDIADNIIEIIKDKDIKVKSKYTSNFFRNEKINNIKIDYLIKIPENMDVDVSNSFGKVDVNGIVGSLNVNNNNGRVQVKSYKWPGYNKEFFWGCIS